MKTYKQYKKDKKSILINQLGDDEFTEQEEYFLELIHLDDLEIKFNFAISGYKNIIYYFYDNKCLIENDKNIKIGVNKELIFDKIANNIHYNVYNAYTLTYNTIEILIEKYFDLDNINLSNLFDYHIYEIENILTN